MVGGGARLSGLCLQIIQFQKKKFCGWEGGRGEQEGVLGKVNYFYKESKSNIKEKKLGGGGGEEGGGWGMMVGGGWS